MNNENETKLENQTCSSCTFEITVKFRQNATWQGSVSWVEGGEQKPFRSALELLKLMDSTMDSMGMESDG